MSYAQCLSSSNAACMPCPVASNKLFWSRSCWKIQTSSYEGSEPLVSTRSPASSQPSPSWKGTAGPQAASTIFFPGNHCWCFPTLLVCKSLCLKRDCREMARTLSSHCTFIKPESSVRRTLRDQQMLSINTTFNNISNSGNNN